MWSRRFSSWLLAAGLATGWATAQTDGLDAMLTQFQAQGRPNPQQLQQNLNQISLGLRRAGAVDPRLRGYLGGVQGMVGGNQNLGLMMSGIYRRMGGLENDPRMAWMNYRSSYLLLNQFPINGQIRNEMQEIRRQVEVVEAKMPQLPKMDWASLDAAAQKEYDETMERYISVSSAASSAEVLAETMKRSMAQQGLALRPEVVSGLVRMNLKLEDAKRMIEQKNFAGAKDRLGSVEAESQKVLKAFGG